MTVGDAGGTPAYPTTVLTTPRSPQDGAILGEGAVGELGSPTQDPRAEFDSAHSPSVYDGRGGVTLTSFIEP